MSRTWCGCQLWPWAQSDVCRQRKRLSADRNLAWLSRGPQSRCQALVPGHNESLKGICNEIELSLVREQTNELKHEWDPIFTKKEIKNIKTYFGSPFSSHILPPQCTGQASRSTWTFKAVCQVSNEGISMRFWMGSLRNGVMELKAILAISGARMIRILRKTSG